MCFCLQKLLGISQAEIRQKFQERVKELEELKTTVDSLKVMVGVGVGEGVGVVPDFNGPRSLTGPC